MNRIGFLKALLTPFLAFLTGVGTARKKSGVKSTLWADLVLREKALTIEEQRAFGFSIAQDRHKLPTDVFCTLLEWAGPEAEKAALTVVVESRLGVAGYGRDWLGVAGHGSDGGGEPG